MIANRRLVAAVKAKDALRRGINTTDSKRSHAGVAKSSGLSYTDYVPKQLDAGSTRKGSGVRRNQGLHYTGTPNHSA
jgi:hypothetical protein